MLFKEPNTYPGQLLVMHVHILSIKDIRRFPDSISG